MTQAEFYDWVAFYQLYPFDDRHRFHRPAALIAHAMTGGDIDSRLDWLQPEPSFAGLNEAELRTLRAFGFTKKGL